MTMFNNSVILTLIIVFNSVLLGFLIFSSFKPLNIVHMMEYDTISKISCGSDSMGLIFDCSDKVYERYLKENERLVEGEIYAYEKGNNTIIHRLVYCIDNCSTAIFKGDNNRVGEKIKRENVIAQVIGVQY